MAKRDRNKETSNVSENTTDTADAAETLTEQTNATEAASDSENDGASGEKQVTIAGIPFTVPQPFAEGHVCTANEAAALNQLIVENLRNNFAQQIGKMKAEAEAGKAVMPSEAELQQKFSEYAASYQFGIRRASSGAPKSADPVERELQAIAMKMVKDALKGKGYKLKEFNDEQIEAIAADLIKNRPELREVAQRRVDEMKSLDVKGLDLPVASKTAAPETAAASEGATAE